MTASKAAPGSPQNAGKRRTKKEPKRARKVKNIQISQNSDSVIPVAVAVLVADFSVAMSRSMDSADGLHMKAQDSDIIIIITTTLTTDEVV
jgi:hypothetical protein